MIPQAFGYSGPLRPLNEATRRRSLQSLGGVSPLWSHRPDQGPPGPEKLFLWWLDRVLPPRLQL